LQATVTSGDLLDCVFRNIRKPKITVKKVLSPSSTPAASTSSSASRW